MDFSYHADTLRSPAVAETADHTAYDALNEWIAYVYTVSHKKQATLIFAVSSPPVQIFLQFLKHFVQE